MVPLFPFFTKYDKIFKLKKTGQNKIVNFTKLTKLRLNNVRMN